MQTENKFPAFSKYVCAGDSVSVNCGPYTITARIVPDDDMRPTDFDCYGPDEMKAWERGEWSFVGIVLSVSVDGFRLDSHAASLWGIDCNFPGGDNAYLQEIANDLLPEALERAETIRASLLAKLA
jgi:hypothetical protein